MSFLTQAEIDALRITRSVFHIVGPGEAHFQLLSEFDATKFASFFLERVRSVNVGNSYKFLADSPVRTQLQRILIDPRSFQEESENLATAFNRAHGGAAAIGAFLIFVLETTNKVVFAFLKFDDERVISYDFKKVDGGRPKPTFGEIERTFVANRNALQKAALIQIGDPDDQICVVDRQNPQKPAAYFENFLLAIRSRTETQMTSEFTKIAIEAIRKHKSDLPPDAGKLAYERLYTAAQNNVLVDAEKIDEWFTTIVGPLPANSPVLKYFKSKLKKNGLGGESFKFEKGALAPPRRRRIETASGIKLAFPINLPKSVVSIDSVKGVITINDRITVDDLDPGSS
ncbi:MAG: nucleoid-associated protein, partial [Saprospiraceae bacterium]|nr:nucleoid-associated protein [Saprospiraceae bacterium]